ncbi:efflux RND transporter periplasmic adaptor subunit [Alicycliphilus denitrificans]|uniref:Efflux transporter, RND family, MFP subunit n=1 Tax=Alicycliphilus denitrificans (strain DSM 14773 / CIP 107495 / K601) TaxID=596154 RepID=F4GBA9_ALIDK|nr:efflux RND transporter periplasmic adaptor subunit [Alicycliphilus denitrificans]ADU99868.1 efflux transporter, RND family, MFP subunit [Alicycliphilus denitrificans BC]AEB84685.1 efflux transporter, RND family, MFP subunit [Alicycliphilus denitrificans K601]GAO23522.1 RND family efflux transporter MFP subunit [Alicycliphilus sp. B1]
MKVPHLQRRTLALIAAIVPLAALFVYVVLRSGPLAPVAVTLGTVQSRAVAPALAGIGTVQARYIYKIGPTAAGRVQRLDVHVGDMVRAGQVLGEMDPVDLDERIRAQQAAIKSAEAGLRQAEARQSYALDQARRYGQLVSVRATSEENLATRQQELAVADAALAAAREDASRLRSELQALRAQRGNLRLVAPVAGLVAARDADPGTTVVAGQAVIRLMDPASLWVDARFDQISAQGLAAGLPAEVVLRSRHGQPLAARVLRTEPLADAVTEELLAKVIFDALPRPLPPIGELAEVTVHLPPLPEAPTIPNAALRTVDGQRGVWKFKDGELAFAPLRLGRADLDGQVQVREGLAVGDAIVVYSERTLGPKSRVHVVERIAGVSP